MKHQLDLDVIIKGIEVELFLDCYYNLIWDTDTPEEPRYPAIHYLNIDSFEWLEDTDFEHQLDEDIINEWIDRNLDYIKIKLLEK